MSHQRRSGLRRDGGASAVEYGAILILVAALAAVFTVVALPERVKTDTAAAICQLFGDAEDCLDDQPPPAGTTPNNGDPEAGDDPAVDDPAGDGPELPGPTTDDPPPETDPADPAAPVLDPNDPDVQAYNNAKNEADAADQALNDLDNLSDEVKQEIIDLLKDLVGITDIEDCLSKGDIVACISALAGFVPWGKVFKLLKKIPGAVKLAKRLKELWDKLGDARDRKKKADDALEDAKNKLEDGGACPIDPPNSFPSGTRVLLADGTSRPIERIRVGDRVWATDPLTGASGPRPVTHLIDARGAKRLVTLALGPLGRFGPTVTATANHPFWNPGTRAWQAAEHLPPGTPLGAGPLTLASVRPHTAVASVHNLTVADLHTYYVLAGEVPVLVHNAQCPRFIVDSSGNVVVLPQVQKKISRQKQDRHILNGNGYRGGGYFTSHADAQAVLDAYHSGQAQVMGVTKNGHIQIRVTTVTGFDNNPRAGRNGVPTNIFLIKGTQSPSVVPTNPNASPP